MRGLPGCGKSTFIRQRGLEAYTLSPDSLRMAYGGPVYEANGRQRVPAEYDRAVWQLALELLEKRMFRGELVIFDATHTHPRSFQNYQALARKHRYQVLVVDFSDVPFEVCMERNAQRGELEPYRVVPPLEMERMRDNMERTRIPKWATLVPARQLEEVLQTKPKDVSQYRQVNIIGDIQGCYDPLMEYFETYGLNDNELYVFVGDYLDRGPQNAEVMQWLLDHYHRPNLVFIEGNHEAHLRAWVQGSAARSREFNERTRPQLEAAGIQSKKVNGFVYQLREMFWFESLGRQVLVSHGGLSTLPSNLAFVNSVQLIKGVGSYEEVDEADASFAHTAPADVYQVHGHRNRYSTPTQVNERCFNLEGKVEFGGELRTVSFAADGIELRPIKSSLDASDDIIDPVGDRPGQLEDVSKLIGMLRASGTVYEKPQEGTHISSFNFKRDVFFNKKWDELNVHARGLFVNTAQNVIVARSYEKFFNVGERPETQPDVLSGRLKFPVKVWVKENGYLGLVGYDPECDDFVFASKSSLTSEFAGWLRARFDVLVTDEKVRRELLLYLKSDGGKTLIFEVIEPEHDPHIVEYLNPELVLLDIVRNTVKFEPADEAERKRIATMLGCRSKQLMTTLKSYEAFEGWSRVMKDFDYKFQGCHLEGFVLEDSEGFMVKVKLPWYAFWRQMRTQLERLQSGKKAGLPALEINGELAREFVDFMRTKSSDELKGADICKLRNEFYGKSS